VDIIDVNVLVDDPGSSDRDSAVAVLVSLYDKAAVEVSILVAEDAYSSEEVEDPDTDTIVRSIVDSRGKGAELDVRAGSIDNEDP